MDLSIAISIVSGLVAVCGAAVAIYNARHSARKATVDSQSRILADLSADYNRLNAENERLLAQLAGIKSQYAELMRKYDTLEWQYRHVCLWAREKGYQLPPPPPPDDV